MKKLYQSSWETFVGGAGVLTFFGNTDLTTLRYVSAKLGRIGINLERASRASGPDLARGVNPIQEDLRESALLEPHEVELTLARETGRVLVLAAGRKPVILQRARYYETGRLAACSTLQGNRQHGAVGSAENPGTSGVCAERLGLRGRSKWREPGTQKARCALGWTVRADSL